MAQIYAVRLLNSPSFAARSQKGTWKYFWQCVIYSGTWKKHPILFHHGSPINNLMTRIRGRLSHRGLCCGWRLLLAAGSCGCPGASGLPGSPAPGFVPVCVDPRCMLNAVLIFTFCCCAISKCIFRACVKQPGIAFPWETSLDNEWFLPICASSNWLPKVGTVVEVEVSKQTNHSYPVHLP